MNIKTSNFLSTLKDGLNISTLTLLINEIIQYFNNLNNYKEMIVYDKLTQMNKDFYIFKDLDEIRQIIDNNILSKKLEISEFVHHCELYSL